MSGLEIYKAAAAGELGPPPLNAAELKESSSELAA